MIKIPTQKNDGKTDIARGIPRWTGSIRLRAKMGLKMLRCSFLQYLPFRPNWNLFANVRLLTSSITKVAMAMLERCDNRLTAPNISAFATARGLQRPRSSQRSVAGATVMTMHWLHGNQAIRRGCNPGLGSLVQPPTAYVTARPYPTCWSWGKLQATQNCRSRTCINLNQPVPAKSGAIQNCELISTSLKCCRWPKIDSFWFTNAELHFLYTSWLQDNWEETFFWFKF